MDPARVYRDLHMRTQHMFQTFGWMVLAKEHKHVSQINGYNESLERLLGALKEKQGLEEYTNELQVLETNVILLQQAAKKLFGLRKPRAKN